MSMTTGEIPVDGSIDSRVHLMPERLMVAIREALNDEAGWGFDQPTESEAIEATLREHRDRREAWTRGVG